VREAGAVAGAATGAALGSLGGPIGAIIGALAGTAGGWWAARVLAEAASTDTDQDERCDQPGGASTTGGSRHVSYDDTWPGLGLPARLPRGHDPGL
jgi:phage tail tape-measure protein